MCIYRKKRDTVLLSMYECEWLPSCFTFALGKVRQHPLNRRLGGP